MLKYLQYIDFCTIVIAFRVIPITYSKLHETFIQKLEALIEQFSFCERGLGNYFYDLFFTSEERKEIKKLFPTLPDDYSDTMWYALKKMSPFVTDKLFMDVYYTAYIRWYMKNFPDTISYS